MHSKRLKSIDNIEKYVIEKEEKGRIKATELIDKIKSETNSLSREELLELSNTLIFSYIMENYFTEESISKFFTKFGM
jgi:hypothetical protein